MPQTFFQTETKTDGPTPEIKELAVNSSATELMRDDGPADSRADSRGAVNFFATTELIRTNILGFLTDLDLANVWASYSANRNGKAEDEKFLHGIKQDELHYDELIKLSGRQLSELCCMKGKEQLALFVLKDSELSKKLGKYSADIEFMPMPEEQGVNMGLVNPEYLETLNGKLLMNIGLAHETVSLSLVRKYADRLSAQQLVELGRTYPRSALAVLKNHASRLTAAQVIGLGEANKANANYILENLGAKLSGRQLEHLQKYHRDPIPLNQQPRYGKFRF